MNNGKLINFVKNFVETDPANYVAEEKALRGDIAGMRIYDEPLIAFASAGDNGFSGLKNPSAIGSHFLLPSEWLPGAESVVSVFFPFTEQIKASNRQDMEWPSKEWMHGRIEGAGFIVKFCRAAVSLMEAEGFKCLAPIADSRFSTKNPVIEDSGRQEFYTSNWSERHIANICGLGTFGLSRGLITKKGTAGRFASFVTTAVFEPSGRPYSGLYDYCSRCGSCVKNCPVGAISKDEGKKHQPCSRFLDQVKGKNPPYYGCGKCQVKVPCENGIPAFTQ